MGRVCKNTKGKIKVKTLTQLKEMTRNKAISPGNIQNLEVQVRRKWTFEHDLGSRLRFPSLLRCRCLLVCQPQVLPGS